MSSATILEVKTYADILNAVREELGIQSDDTTAMNRLRRDINSVYLDELVPFREWAWLRGQITLATTPVVTDGTADVSEGSRNVTLTSTGGISFKGFYFSAGGYEEVYRITEHSSSSLEIVLETAFAGATNPTASYKIWTDTVPLPTDCLETMEVRSDWRDTPLDGVGIKKYRQYVAANPLAEDRPSIYTTGDYVDPVPYAAIAGLPNINTIASDGLVKTIVFVSAVTAIFQVGDRIEVSGENVASFNGRWIIASVQSATITFTGTERDDSPADGADGMIIRALQPRANSRVYKELWVYPSIFNTASLLHVDYAREAARLAEATDEPLMPISDRLVLVYGALERGWAKQRNPEESKRNGDLFRMKRAKMAGLVHDSTSYPVLTPSKAMLATKRRMRRLRYSFSSSN